MEEKLDAKLSRGKKLFAMSSLFFEIRVSIVRVRFYIYIYLFLIILIIIPHEQL